MTLVTEILDLMLLIYIRLPRSSTGRSARDHQILSSQPRRRLWLTLMMMQMSEDEIERIFKEIDKDESGSITKKEAVRACRRFLTFMISS